MGIGTLGRGAVAGILSIGAVSGALVVRGDAVASVGSGVGEPAAYAGASLSAEQANADLDLLERVLDVLHPGYERYAARADLDGLFASIRNAVSGGATDAEMYLAVTRILEAIRCDHTKAEYPRALREHRETAATFPPVRPHIIDGRLYAGTNGVDGLERGDEIVAINGVPGADLVEQTLGLISIDAFTEHARVAEAEVSREYMGSGLWHFMPLVHGWSDRFAFEWVDASGERRSGSADAATIGEYWALVASGERAASDFVDAVSVERLGERGGVIAAVLRVDTFVNYRRPVDAMALFSELFSELNATGVGHLVVDLRVNGGGSDDAQIALGRHLITEPVEVFSGSLAKTVPVPEDVKRAVSTWDPSVMETTPEQLVRTTEGFWAMPTNGPVTVEPAPDAFRGRVTLLSSLRNSSGSTNLLAVLQQKAGLRVVGEPTGGNVAGGTAGVIGFCTLPNSGVTVRVPLLRVLTGLDAPGPDGGVVPDVVVARTPAGVFGAGDPVLEAALEAALAWPGRGGGAGAP